MTDEAFDLAAYHEWEVLAAATLLEHAELVGIARQFLTVPLAPGPERQQAQLALLMAVRTAVATGDGDAAKAVLAEHSPLSLMEDT